MSRFEAKFLCRVEETLTTKDPFQLRSWMAHEQYREQDFDLLSTSVLEALNQQTRKAKGDFEELQSLLDRILLRRYLLGSRLEEFLGFADRNCISVPLQVMELIDNWSRKGEPYQRQAQLIETLAHLQCDSALFKEIKADVQARFLDHQLFVNVVTTVGNPNHSIRRAAITFAVKADGKVRNTQDIFLSAQKIQAGFRQAIEEIQDAMQLSDDTGRFWIKLGVLQELIRNAESGLDGRSAQAAIGWLTSMIENQIPFGKAYLLSVWGVYQPQKRQFSPVGGLKAKLDACQEDGIRVVALPQATLGKHIESGMTFGEYAEEKQISLIAFPDDMLIHAVYDFIWGKCRELGIISNQPADIQKKNVEEENSHHESGKDELLLEFDQIKSDKIDLINQAGKTKDAAHGDRDTRTTLKAKKVTAKNFTVINKQNR